MIRRLVWAAAALVVLFFGPAAAQEIPEPLTRRAIEEEMRRTGEELERIREELEAKRRKARQLAGQEQDLEVEIDRINDEIRMNRELLSKLGERKSVLLKDLELTRRELSRAQSSFESAQDLLSRRLRAIYKFGRIEMMEVILLSRSFADLAKRIYYLSMVADHDRELVREFEERVETRKVLLDHIAGKRSRLEVVEEEVAAEMRNLELKRGERDHLVRRLKEKRSYYENLADDLAEASRNLEELLGELETRSEEAGPPAGFEARKGEYMWPCEGEVIGEFGVQTHPRFGTIIRNNGIDIKAVPGTKVRSVAAGLVSYAGTLTGFGNCIILNHGGGFYTLYGRLETLIVEKGYQVREGDSIGYLGETSAEGAVLHFEIRRGKQALDPGEWLLR
jgi:septal ring factor EnvC (AmiA/AmiB activator)